MSVFQFCISVFVFLHLHCIFVFGGVAGASSLMLAAPYSTHGSRPAVLEWTSGQPDSILVIFCLSSLAFLLLSFICIPSSIGVDLGWALPEVDRDLAKTREGDFVRRTLDPISGQLVPTWCRSGKMFALLLFTTTAAAQDYCAITPKHTACGQKVGMS